MPTGYYWWNPEIVNIIGAIGTIIAGICAIIGLLYKRYIYKLKERTRQLNKFREELCEIRCLLYEIKSSTEESTISTLAEELALKLSYNITQQGNNYTLESLLTPSNQAYLISIINTVRGNNKSIQVQTQGINKLKLIIDDISRLFPIYTWSLAIIIHLLLFYKEQKTSTQQLITILSNKTVQQRLQAAYCSTNSAIPTITQISTVLAYYIKGTAVFLDPTNQIIMSEDISDLLYVIAEILLNRYIELSDTALEQIAQRQVKAKQKLKKEYSYSGGTSFIQDFLEIFTELHPDFNIEDRQEIKKHMQSIGDLLIRNGFWQGKCR